MSSRPAGGLLVRGSSPLWHTWREHALPLLGGDELTWLGLGVGVGVGSGSGLGLGVGVGLGLGVGVGALTRR